MKKYQDLSVRVKISLKLGIASILVFSLVCVMMIVPIRKSTLTASADQARLTADLAGERLAVEFNASASIIPAYASIISGLIDSKTVPMEAKRQTLIEDISAMILSDATAVNNAWVIMEPNALDGMDEHFINQMGSNEYGVLSARWNSAGNIFSADYEINNNLFRQVKQSRQIMTSQPYQDELNGRTVWMITALAPIMHEDKFCGVLATDFNLEELCNMVKSLNTIGEGKLVTYQGAIAAHSDYSRVGDLAEYGNREILDLIKTGKPFEGFFTVDDVHSFKVYVPVMFATNINYWFYAVDVTPEKIYEDAVAQTRLLIIFSILGVVMITISGFFLIRPLLNSVVGVTGIIHQLSTGRINLNISENNSKDEIGTMKNALNMLLNGLKNSVGFAKEIGEGNLSADYLMLSDDDALGDALLEMRKSLQEAETQQAIRTKEEEQRSWGTAGLAKFAEILRRDNNDMEALSNNVISNMVKYLDINQGGIFVVNEAEREEDRVLEMKGCYAFDRKKFLDKQVRPGEGLVGTCFLEGEPIYLTDVPKNYISITSGLGDANPRSIFICPLKVNDQIFGVIELASFNSFEPYQLDFVKKVSESIASTISTVNINIRTGRLLEQTKMQAEEMANSEEELRQNMEEMQATQEESHRREIELQESLTKVQETQAIAETKEHAMRQFQYGIINTNSVVEFSSDGIITDVNQNICNLFGGVNKSVFVGSHMAKFNGEEVYNRFMGHLKRGELYENLNVVEVNGKRLTIRQKFMPITNKEGHLERAWLLAFHDQEEELRKNMEVIQNREFEAKQLQDMIFNSFNIVEISAEGVVTEINQNVLNSFKTLTRKDFVGAHLSNFYGKELADEIMATVTKGKTFENLQNMPTGPDEMTVFRQKFIPICKKDGQLLRVILMTYPDHS